MRARAVANLAMVAAFAAFCVGGLAFLAVGLGLEVPGRGGYRLTADFASAEGLVPQDDVAVAGVKVGRVVGVHATGGGTLVDMRIDAGVPVRTDVRAVVRPKSQLGEKYVLLVRNHGSGAAQAGDGYRIPRERTGAAVEIDDVISNMDPEARAAFTETLRQLGVATAGQGPAINQSLRPLADTSASFRPLAATAQARQAEIDRILTDLTTIMQALADEQDSLGRIVDSGNTAFGAVAARDRALAGTVRQADLFFAELDLAFADLTPADRASLEKAPGTIESGRKLLTLTNPELDRLLPELLLAQVNYPSNQLNVTSPRALALAYEWESAFAQTDVQGHSFRFTNINGPESVTVAAPAGGPAPAPPGAPGSSGGGAAPGLPAPLQFLLGLGVQP